MTAIIINGVLVLFGTLMTYMLLWRVLFFDTNREPDPLAIEAFIARCKRGGSLEPDGRFGALQQCFDEAGRDARVLRISLERFRRLVERHHDAISVVANAAMGIGFLGTVASMAGAAGGKVDPVQIIGLGMMSTMYGLIIALPGSMFHGLSNGRVMRFLDYTDALLEALDERNNPPTSSAVVPSPSNRPSPNGHTHKRLPEYDAENVRRRSATVGKSELTEGDTFGWSSPASVVADSAVTPGTTVDQVLAQELDFGERAARWVAEMGGQQE